MKKKKYLWLLLLLCLPTIVFAAMELTGENILGYVCLEILCTLIVSFTVILPLAKVYALSNTNKWFWKFFWIRLILITYSYWIGDMVIIAFDLYILTIFGWLIVKPIIAAKKKSLTKNIVPNAPTTTPTVENSSDNSNGLIVSCTKCNSQISITDKFCSNCGAAILGDNISVSLDPIFKKPETRKTLSPVDFDPMFRKSEDLMLEDFIKREMKNCKLLNSSRMMPQKELKRKIILNVLFMILVFVYVSMVFFHFPIATYIVGAIILFICYKLFNKYNLINYLKKQVKARPSEKVSNIVMATKESMVKDNTSNYVMWGIFAAALLPLVVFLNPHVMYEKMDEGYGVRFYTFGVLNFSTAEIPSEYKGEPVISLRGNTFSNMPFLVKVKLPDTVTEIRGQAFKNDSMLKEVNIPKNLKYLGGGAFYNCKNIEKIELPDTLEVMGGEVFYGASKLKEVKLSKELEEIRGNSFEECVSLKEIEIPDKVKRIGGHAFYHNSSLSKVTFGADSQLEEIGSSAFRLCSRLTEIYIPERTAVNSRAFKESPTKVFRYSDGFDTGFLAGYNPLDYEEYYVNNSSVIDLTYEDGSTHDVHVTISDLYYDRYDQVFVYIKFSVSCDGKDLGIYRIDDSNDYFTINDQLLFYMPEEGSNYLRIYKK